MSDPLHWTQNVLTSCEAWAQEEKVKVTKAATTVTSFVCSSGDSVLHCVHTKNLNKLKLMIQFD